MNKESTLLNMVIAYYCVRMWFSSGKVFNRVFDDHDEARLFMNAMIMKPNVENAHLWEL